MRSVGESRRARESLQEFSEGDSGPFAARAVQDPIDSWSSMGEKSARRAILLGRNGVLADALPLGGGRRRPA